jgi:hypothetical protein
MSLGWYEVTTTLQSCTLVPHVVRCVSCSERVPSLSRTSAGGDGASAFPDLMDRKMQCISDCGVPSRVQSPSPIGLTWDVIMSGGQIGLETQVSEIVFLMLPFCSIRTPRHDAPRLDVRGGTENRRCAVPSGIRCQKALAPSVTETLWAVTIPASQPCMPCVLRLAASGSRSAPSPPASRSSFFPRKFPEKFIGLTMYAPGSTNQRQDQM